LDYRQRGQGLTLELTLTIEESVFNFSRNEQSIAREAEASIEEFPY
jgi:hypothetical protein